MARFNYNDMKAKYEKLFEYYSNASSELVKPFCFDRMQKNLPDEFENISGFLMCQLLEFFSKGVRLVSEDEYLESADYIYERVVHEAYDTTFGGYYEMLKGEGGIVSDKKLLETQCMAMVSLSEYACAKQITKDEEYHVTAILNRALALYTMIEHYSRCKSSTLYFPEMNKDWSPAGNTGDAEIKALVSASYRLLYAGLAFVDSKATGTLKLINDTIAGLNP